MEKESYSMIMVTSTKDNSSLVNKKELESSFTPENLKIYINRFMLANSMTILHKVLANFSPLMDPHLLVFSKPNHFNIIFHYSRSFSQIKEERRRPGI